MNIRVWVKTDKVGSKSETFIRVNKEEWKNMWEQDREELCRVVMLDMIEWNYEVVE
jgi:hypothetical protein